MKLNYIGLATMLAFAVFATARTQAQPPPPVEGKNIGSPMEEHSLSSAAIAGDVQEQVEILRRLLKRASRRSTALYPPRRDRFLRRALTTFGAAQWAEPIRLSFTQEWSASQRTWKECT